MLVLTSNRGLCGGYNAGVLRLALAHLRELKAKSVECSIEVSGKRGAKFLAFQKVPVAASYMGFDTPQFADVDELATRFITQYIAGDIDRLDIAYTRFESSSRQTAVIESLLPISSLGGVPAAGSTSSVDYEFLPSAQEILEEIVPAAFRAKLFKCFLDAAVSEQIARMVAMKGATENADEMAGTLKQQYNRARQAAITSELAEIIGGAAALG